MITANFWEHHTIFFCGCFFLLSHLKPKKQKEVGANPGSHSVSPQAGVRLREKLLMFFPNQDTWIMKTLIFPNRPSQMQLGNADGSFYHSKQVPKRQASPPSDWSHYHSPPSPKPTRQPQNVSSGSYHSLLPSGFLTEELIYTSENGDRDTNWKCLKNKTPSISRTWQGSCGLAAFHLHRGCNQ